MLTWTFLLTFTFAIGDQETNINLGPTLAKQDYESIEEVKAHEETSTEKVPEDTEWIPEAILDVAYYLRRHKFNGFDRRYQVAEEQAIRNLYIRFPDPPLRNLHWEVKKYCEPSFIDCIKYLSEQTLQTALPRHMDTLTIMNQNSWSIDKDLPAIQEVDSECLKLKEKDDKSYEIFQGPLQKFQWLTTAIYYMCWYTMVGKPYLEHFSESCDNYANCMNWQTGPNNLDVRADNSKPFGCSMYSFCPDPCCSLKHVKSSEGCLVNNSCHGHQPTNETCLVKRSENGDFESMILNHWNVTCHCDDIGMRWESKSGMCVDIDECAEFENLCQIPAESCINLPGSYDCVCNIMGYQHDVEKNSCAIDPVVQSVLYPHHYNSSRSGKLSLSNALQNLVDKWKSFLSVSTVNNELEENRTDAKSPNLFTEPKK